MGADLAETASVARPVHLLNEVATATEHVEPVTAEIVTMGPPAAEPRSNAMPFGG